MTKIAKIYIKNSVSLSNFKLCIFAIKKHVSWARCPISSEFLQRLSAMFPAAGSKDNDMTNLSWSQIVHKCRPFIEDDSNDVIDRFLLAIYTMIPPRRSDIWNLNQPNSPNTLQNGKLVIKSYKTARKYGPFECNLFEPGIFHGSAEAALFRKILSDDINIDFGCSSMQAFAGRVARLFSRVVGQRCSILDLRRAFDAHVRQWLSDPSIPAEKRRQIKDVLAYYTAHSGTMSEYYADKVDLS